MVHKGERRAYGSKVLQPKQRVGIHMDRSTNTLSFSVDGVDMGVAFTGLPVHDLYPVVNVPLKGCVLHSEPFIRGLISPSTPPKAKRGKRQSVSAVAGARSPLAQGAPPSAGRRSRVSSLGSQV